MSELEDNVAYQYKVVTNLEGQYSIWPIERDNPIGWNDVGMRGTKDECLAYINIVWTDLRPKSLQDMEK